MELHTIQVLELGAVFKLLTEYCFTESAPPVLEAGFVNGCDAYFQDEELLTEFKARCAVIRTGLVRSGELVSDRVETVDECLEILAKTGSVLELENLARLMRFVRSGNRITQCFRNFLQAARDASAPARGEVPVIPGMVGVRDLVDSVPNLRALEQLLTRYLDDEGNLKEDQIPELRNARARIFQAQSELRKAAQSILAEKAQYTSGEFATIRDGRTVIPLKTDFKGRVPGIIHQSSGTGATLFVEPFELVERNNACAEAEGAYAQAVHAILRQLTINLSNETGNLAQMSAILHELDLMYARARFSQVYDCTPASPGAQIDLIQARHPLIGRKVIPIDIRFEADSQLMVISGPNTGGKTVALKTLGLMVLMNQAGLDLPAQRGCTLPLFSRVLADIGDEQSISASLSTFSGHVSRISSFLAQVDRNALVLLDELGSGTDPEEGSALAIAVTEELLRSGCHTLITSHHGALKALAFSTPGARNASMEFSDTELRPTYRVISGVPGQSHALDIAQRVGMPTGVLSRAREFLEGRQTPLEELVRDLSRQHQELLAAKSEAQILQNKLANRLAEVENRQSAIAQRELELRKTQVAESSTFLREARSGVEALLRELATFRNDLDSEKAERLAEVSRDARLLLGTLADAQGTEEAAVREIELRNAGEQDLKPGIDVYIRNTSQHGVLEREVKPGRWLVSVHNKKVEFRADQLQVPDAPISKPKKNTFARPVYSVDSSRTAVFTLDLRGMRALAAQEAIIKQIDAAMVQGMDFFSIIHGKGEGILQKMIHDYLKKCPGVDRFAFAMPEDGGTGKTLVYLRH